MRSHVSYNIRSGAGATSTRESVDAMLRLLQPGQQFIFTASSNGDEHAFIAVALEESGMHSGRRRFLVVCLSCRMLLHEATTGPTCWPEEHVLNKSAGG